MKRGQRKSRMLVSPRRERERRRKCPHVHVCVYICMYVCDSMSTVATPASSITSRSAAWHYKPIRACLSCRPAKRPIDCLRLGCEAAVIVIARGV